jgi:hypothetical protein
VALHERRGFRDVLEKDPQVQTAFGAAIDEVLGEAFDVTRALAHADRVISALDAVETIPT